MLALMNNTNPTPTTWTIDSMHSAVSFCVVTLVVAEITKQQKDHNQRVRIGASATAMIKRSEFGITYNLVLEAGGIALADEVALTFDMSLVQDDADMLYARGPWRSSTWMTSRSS